MLSNETIALIDDLKLLIMLHRALSSNDARGKFGGHRRSVRVV